MMIIAVGSGEQIARLVPELGGLPRRPLLTLERVRVRRRDGHLLSPPSPLPATDEPGLPVWQKLMVCASEQARHGRSPLHVALGRRLREGRASGATCLRGIWGFHGDHPPHGDRPLQLRRHVPVVTIIVDTPRADRGLVRNRRRAHRRGAIGHERRWCRRSRRSPRGGASGAGCASRATGSNRADFAVFSSEVLPA